MKEKKKKKKMKRVQSGVSGSADALHSTKKKKKNHASPDMQVQGSSQKQSTLSPSVGRNKVKSQNASSELQLLGTSATKSLAKCLIESLSSNGDHLNLYRGYLSALVNFSVSYRVLSCLDDEMLASFYQQENPLAHPKYFDFFDGADRARFESITGFQLVILQGGAKDSWKKIHDQRALVELSDDAEALKKEKPVVVFHIRWGSAEEGWLLYRAKNLGSYVPLFSEKYFYTSKLVPGSGCFICDAGNVLQTCTEHSPSHRRTYREAILEADRMEIGTAVGKSFMLVTHIRSNPKAKTFLTCSPRNQVFANLGFFSCEPLTAEEALPVLAVTTEGAIYQLSKRYADAVKKRHREIRIDRREPFPGLSGKVLDVRGAGEEQRFNRLQGQNAAADTLVDEGRNGCACNGCLESELYKKNMSFDGPQKLYKCELGLFDLLRMMGKEDAASLEAVRKACRYSVASFDVESFARPVERLAGREGEPAEKDVPTVSGLKLQAEVYAVQEPVLIGYLDEQMRAEGKPPLILRLEPDKRFGLEASFLTTLLDRKAAVVRAKKDLLKPLFSWILLYKKAHFNFFFGDRSAQDFDDACEDSQPATDCESGSSQSSFQSSRQSQTDNRDGAPDRIVGEPEETEKKKYEAEIAKSWEHSLLGKIEKKLLKLEETFNVFGFNAENFDLVILCNRLVTHARELRLRVKLQLDGSKIRKIKIAGIHIGEIKRLMPPGYSLDAMGKTCGIAETKGIFPFALLTSANFLKNKSLPANAAQWASSLAPEKSPAQEEVNEALKIFADNKFNDVGEYLEYYLALDVLVLQKSILVMQAKYYEILGIDIVESNRFTASSLSALAAQSFLARNKRIGHFFPNHARLYNVSFFCFFFKKKERKKK